jgi:hypothetical protein
VASLIWDLLFPGSRKFPNTKSARTEDIPADAWRLGQLWLGRPGSGKTWALARATVDHLIEHPNEAMVSFDANQNFTDAFLTIVLSKPKEIRDALIKRIIYDEIGHPVYTITMPDLHESYKVPMEKQIKRSIQNFKALNPELMTETPVMGGISVKQYGTELFRLLSVIPNEYGSTWQLTEAKHLLVNDFLLNRMLHDYGALAPTAKWFFEKKFKNLKDDEKDKRTLGLISVLDDIEAPEIRPRIGYHRPSIAMPQLIDEAKIWLINGHNINDQESTLAFEFVRLKSIIMNEISKRTPNNPNDYPFTMIFDEVPAVLNFMSDEITSFSTYFRSRQLQPVVVAQMLSQFPDDLREQIFGYASVVCFSLLPFQSRFQVAQELFPYISDAIKAQAKTGTQQDIYEPDRGQYLQIANEIYNLKHRECIVRRQRSEKESNNELVWIARTKEAPATATMQDVQRLKDELMQEYGVRVNESNASINRRIKENKKGVSEAKIGPPKVG